MEGISPPRAEDALSEMPVAAVCLRKSRREILMLLLRPTCSETQLETKLQHSRHGRGSGAHEIVSADSGVESRPLGVIEDVERFCPKLHVQPFRRFAPLVERHVEVCATRHVQTISSGVSKGEASSLHVGAWIEQQRSFDSRVGREPLRRQGVRVSDYVKLALLV